VLQKKYFQCTDSYLGGNCIVLCVEPIGTMLLSLDGSIVFFFFFGGPLSKKQINEKVIIDNISNSD
jgi:hypothetical protein